MDTPREGSNSRGATPRTPGAHGATERTTAATGRSVASGHAGEEDYSSDCVRIGDIVFLHGVDVEGLLFADGFVDENCWLGQAERDKDHELIMDALFVVNVKNFHIAVERLRTAEARLDDLVNMTYDDAIYAKASAMQLKKAVESERVANELETRRSLGAVVRYGDEIELQHLKSGKMLSIQRHAIAGTGKENMSDAEAIHDVLVSDSESENQWFTVEPRFSIQHFSDPLRYGECLSLVASALPDQFLQADRECFEDPAFAGDGFSQHAVHTFRDVFAWKMGVYTPYKAEASVSIEGGEVVRLLHKEEGLEGLYVATGDADGDDDGNDSGNHFSLAHAHYNS